MWFLFALLSGLFYTASGLISRHVLKSNKDAWAYSFFFSAVGSLVSFPFMVIDFKVSNHPLYWFVFLIIGFFIVLHNYLNFRSNNYIEASIQGSIQKFRLVWIFLLGVFVLGESFSWFKLIGTLLTVIGGVIIISKFKVPKSVKGIQLALFATVIYSIVTIVNKELLKEFNPYSLTFFVFFFPIIINFIIIPNRIQRFYKLIKSDSLSLFFGCTFGAFANLTMNKALSVGEVSKVLVIIEAFLIFMLAGEHVILEERKNFLYKFIAVILATFGAILIRWS